MSRYCCMLCVCLVFDIIVFILSGGMSVCLIPNNIDLVVPLSLLIINAKIKNASAICWKSPSKAREYKVYSDMVSTYDNAAIISALNHKGSEPMSQIEEVATKVDLKAELAEREARLIAKIANSEARLTQRIYAAAGIIIAAAGLMIKLL